MGPPNLDHLRMALLKPPIDAKPRKPTSVPPMTLYALMKHRQDRLRTVVPTPGIWSRIRRWWDR